ncbi:MAG: hypothetical protein WCO65_00880 [bacterium]
MNKKIFFYISTVLFFFGGFIHLLRIMTGFEISLGGMTYPLWMTWIEMLVLFYLSFIAFRFTKIEK